MGQCSNLNRVTRDEDLSKNRTTPKSLMDRGSVFRMFFIIAISALLFSCKDDNGKNDDNSNFNSIEELYGEKGLALINEVSEQCETYIESYLQQYFSQSANADINELVNKIKKIDEVAEASPNSDNSVIRIKLKNGACFNHLIIREDDERLMTGEIENIYQQFLDAGNQLRSANSTQSDYNTPNAKKALILAPFQTNKTFPILDDIFAPQDINSLAKYLKNAGYDVTTLKDEEVTIDCLRGDYLKQFGVIYIHTHGGHSFMTLSKEETSMGFLAVRGVAIKKEDNIEKDLAFCVVDGGIQIAVSDGWIKKNLKSLPNSLVYIDACWSGKFKSAFIDNGAGAYVGWNNRSVRPLINTITNNVFNNLSKGKEFDEVYSGSMWSSLESLSALDVGGYFHAKKVSNVPYYLVVSDEWILDDEFADIPVTFSPDSTVTMTMKDEELGTFLLEGTWSVVNNTVTLKFSYNGVTLPPIVGTYNSDKDKITATDWDGQVIEIIRKDKYVQTGFFAGTPFYKTSWKDVNVSHEEIETYDCDEHTYICDRRNEYGTCVSSHIVFEPYHSESKSSSSQKTSLIFGKNITEFHLSNYYTPWGEIKNGKISVDNGDAIYKINNSTLQITYKAQYSPPYDDTTIFSNDESINIVINSNSTISGSGKAIYTQTQGDTEWTKNPKWVKTTTSTFSGTMVAD